MNFSIRPPFSKAVLKVAAALMATSMANPSASAQEPIKILPGDDRFKMPEFEDYQAVFGSSSSKTGGFTLQVRKSGDGKKLSMIDIIPMMSYVIVAQRQIDLKTQRVEFGAGPYFAWGQEYIVSQSDGQSYSWSRNPIGAGEHKEASGKISHKGYVSDMFSPTLSALMPMSIGEQFLLPSANPRKDETVSSELDHYTIVAKERLELDSGLKCECWKIEKNGWNGGIEHVWVSRKAPFVFRRTRDVGGKREFTSDLLSYTVLEQ